MANYCGISIFTHFAGVFHYRKKGSDRLLYESLVQSAFREYVSLQFVHKIIVTLNEGTGKFCGQQIPMGLLMLYIYRT